MKYIYVYIITIIILYLGISFISSEFNVKLWTESQIGGFIFFSFIITYISIILDSN